MGKEDSSGTTLSYVMLKILQRQNIMASSLGVLPSSTTYAFLMLPLLDSFLTLPMLGNGLLSSHTTRTQHQNSGSPKPLAAPAASIRETHTQLSSPKDPVTTMSPKKCSSVTLTLTSQQSLEEQGRPER